MIIRPFLGRPNLNVVPENPAPGAGKEAAVLGPFWSVGYSIVGPASQYPATAGPSPLHRAAQGRACTRSWRSCVFLLGLFVGKSPRVCIVAAGSEPRAAGTSLSHFRNGRCKLWPTSSFEVDESQKSSDVAQSRLACNRRDSTNIVTRKTPDVRRLQQRPIGLPSAELPLHESLRVGFVKVQS